METTSDIKIGQVVKSKAGRDKGIFFVVLEVLDSQYLLIVDGKVRRLNRPKKKKIKHLMMTNKFVDLESKSRIVNDSYIRKQLAPFNNEG